MGREGDREGCGALTKKNKHFAKVAAVSQPPQKWIFEKESNKKKMPREGKRKRRDKKAFFFTHLL
jgi:hypothetical protein